MSCAFDNLRINTIETEIPFCRKNVKFPSPLSTAPLLPCFLSKMFIFYIWSIVTGPICVSSWIKSQFCFTGFESQISFDFGINFVFRLDFSLHFIHFLQFLTLFGSVKFNPKHSQLFYSCNNKLNSHILTMVG